MPQLEQPKYQLQVMMTSMAGGFSLHHLESPQQPHGISHFTDEKRGVGEF